MISIASDALNTIWPSRMVELAERREGAEVLRACTKKISDATAITISGTTSVR